MTKTVSLETAKKLKAAGWPQKPYETNGESVWSARSRRNKTDDGYIFEYHITTFLNPLLGKEGNTPDIAAPDVSELLEALPEDSAVYKTAFGYFADILKNPDANGMGGLKWESPTKDTPAEALAALWLELRERKLV